VQSMALRVEPREPGHPNRDRASGYVPGVVYGKGLASRAVRVEQRALAALLQHGGRRHLIELQVDGGVHPAMIADVQVDPATGSVLHVDFHVVRLTERIHADVPLRVAGEEALAKTGAILQLQVPQVRVECLPTQLPEWIEVDVSGLRVGDTVAAGDLRPPEGVRVLNEADEVLLAVIAPPTGVEEAETPAPAGEPEVIRKGKGVGEEE
jgi:large subunit ribosomal protein L25